jgi:thioredoxin-related protein
MGCKTPSLLSALAVFVFLTLLSSCKKNDSNEQATTGNEAGAAIGTPLVPVTTEGVIFYANNIDQAFAKAKVENKPVFIEIYSESCHVCQSFIPVFKEQTVSDFYNKNFLNYKIEVTSPEFQSFLLAQKIFVPSLPLLLYFDQNRNLIHLGVIEAKGEKLVEQGGLALDPTQRAASMKKRFESGEKGDQFLIDFAMFSRVTMDTVMNRKAMEQYARQQPESSYTSETNYLAVQKLLMDVDNPLGTYFVNHLPAYRKAHDPAEVKNVAENLIMSSLYSSFGSAYSSDKIKQMRDYMIKAEIDPQVARNRVLLPLINAYFRENTPIRAVELVNTHLTQVPLKVPDYLYLLKYFNEHSPDAGYVRSAETWAANALNMVEKNSADEAAIRMELAAAKRRAGN